MAEPMTDPKAAAERIVALYERAFPHGLHHDQYVVARAYISLLSGTDEERARAREVVTRWVYDDDASVKTDAECGPLIARIAAELAAARKRGYAQALKEIAHGQYPEWEARALAAEAALAAVREEERERCARIVDGPQEYGGDRKGQPYLELMDELRENLADAIREGRKHG